MHKVRTSTYLLWGHSSIHNKGIGVILPPKARYPGVLRDGGSSWDLIRSPGLGPRLEVLGCEWSLGVPCQGQPGSPARRVLAQHQQVALCRPGAALSSRGA